MKCSNVLRRGLILTILGLASACGVVPLRGSITSTAADTPVQSPVLSACLEWFNRLDQARRRTGVTDAQAATIHGYPYLRASRLLAAYRQDVVLPTQQRAWLHRLRTLDQRARSAELNNIGAATASEYLGLAQTLPTDQILERTQSCGERLLAYDLSRPARMQQIRERARVPDAYSTFKRAIGLYPLTRPLLARADRDAGRALRAQLQKPPDSLSAANIYWPATVRRGQRLAAALISSRRRDALGLPILTSQVDRWLLQEFAPVIVIEADLQHERDAHPGTVVLKGDVPAQRAALDTDRPAVYGRTALTRYGGSSLVQLVYSVWLPSAGALHGLVFRMTLNAAGEPAIFDSMRASGLDHQFVPTSGAQAHDGEFANLLRPISLPPAPDGHRVRIRISKPGNSLAGIDYVPQSRGNQPYELLPADTLRSLAVNGNAKIRRSLFQPDGIVAGTDTNARYRLWPSGIARVGALRQWGNHAISLTTRRHFDDPALIDHLFSLR